MKYTKKIITSTITLILMIVVLSSGVYAWFTINTKTSAENLTGSAQALDGGFYIRLKGDSDWKTSISLENVVDENFEFTDVTTTNGIDIKTLDGNTATGGFVEFELEFLTGSARNNVYLTSLEIIDSILGASWIAEKNISYTGGVVNAGMLMQANLSDAIRVSVENNGNPKIFEKYGSNDDVAVALTSDTAVFSNTVGFGGFAKLYYTEIMGTLPATPAAREDIVINQDHSTNTLINTTTNNNVPSHDKGDSFTNYGSVKVRVWLEGWDGEAFNAIHSGEVKINFNFNVREQ